MFNTPYQTSSFKNHTFDRTGSVIRMLEIDDRLVRLDNGIYAIPYGEASIPPFSLPITKQEVPNLNADVVVDGRTFLKSDNTPAREDTKDFYLNTSILTRDWMNGNRKDLLQTTTKLHKFYTDWFRNTISGRLGLDMSQTFKIQAIGAIYFLKLIDENYSDEILARRASRVLPAMDYITLLDTFEGEFPQVRDLNDVMEWIRQALDSPRANALTLPYAQLAVAMTWGPAFKEISLAAVEYPPIFASMCYQSLRNSAFLRSNLGQYLKKSVRPNETLEFIKEMTILLNK